MTAIAERPVSTGRPPGPPEAAHRAAEAAREHLLTLQDPAGWWKGELATNVTMDAEDLLLREFLGHLGSTDHRAGGPLDPLPAARRRHLGHLPRRPGELSTTVEAYVALRLAGDAPEQAAHGPRGRLGQGQRRRGGRPGVHPDLAGPVRRCGAGTTCRPCRPS
jgi:squalene-hopene/tetraprenyl-beta-curcumene cyclase